MPRSAGNRHYIAHRLKREAKIVGALEAAPSATPDELVPVAYDDTPIHVWPIALLSLRAHLDKLVAEGRAVVDGERYRLTG